MTRLPKIFWVVAGILFAIASIAINYEVKVGLHQRAAGPVSQMGDLKLGQPAPDFTLKDLSGHPVSLSSYRGHKVVLMDFWATWCGPCRMAMPGLQELDDKFKDAGLETLSVNQGESADHVRNFIKNRKYTFHVLLDSDGAVGRQYGVQAIPALVLVDKKGIIQWMRVGYSPNEDNLRKKIESLVKE